jgi:hypothetical protein
MLQAGNDSGLEVTVGGLTSVSSLSDSSGATITLVDQDCGEKKSILLLPRCHVMCSS